MRVAVIGPGRIGKHHAKWFAAEGAEVIALCCSRPETAADRRRECGDLFGYSGPVFADPAAMLSETRPDAVSIASPPSWHARHIEAALNEGCHVLCEKPLYWDPALPLVDCLATARRLVERADRDLLELCVMTQYVALVPILTEIGEMAIGRRTGIWSFGMRMESKPQVAPSRREGILIDLGPHPLALVQGLLRCARMVESSLEVSVEENRCKAAFDCSALSELPNDAPHQCSVSIVVGKSQAPVREIEVNGLRVVYEGRNDENGVFSAYLRVGDNEAKCEDPMRLTVRHFLQRVSAGVPGHIAAGRSALAALDMLFRIIRAGTREPLLVG